MICGAEAITFLTPDEGKSADQIAQAQPTTFK